MSSKPTTQTTQTTETTKKIKSEPAPFFSTRPNTRSVANVLESIKHFTPTLTVDEPILKKVNELECSDFKHFTEVLRELSKRYIVKGNKKFKPRNESLVIVVYFNIHIHRVFQPYFESNKTNNKTNKSAVKYLKEVYDRMLGNVWGIQRFHYNNPPYSRSKQLLREQVIMAIMNIRSLFEMYDLGEL